jgi:hypothetical protein
LKGHLIEETMVFTCFYHQTWGFPWFSWTLSHRPILGLSANSTLESSSCATTSDLVLDGSGMATELMLDSLGVPQIVITCYQHGTSSTPNKRLKSPGVELCQIKCLDIWSSAPAIVDLHWLIQKGEAIQRS